MVEQLYVAVTLGVIRSCKRIFHLEDLVNALGEVNDDLGPVV